MSKLYACTLLILLTVPVVGQRIEHRIAAGDEFFNQRQYTEAIDVYERILRREQNPAIRSEVSFKIGESYRYLINYSEAKRWYSMALEQGFADPNIFMRLSEMSLGLEQFDEAINYANQFLAVDPNNQQAQKLRESAQFSKANYGTPTIIEVSNEATLNNTGQQWGVAFLENFPIFFEDQELVDQQYNIDVRLRFNNIFYWAWVTRTLKDRIVFSSTMALDGEADYGFSNIYQATFNKRSEDWDPPKLLSGDINSPYYDGFLSFDPINQVAYFMNSGGLDGTRPNSDIYVSSLDINTDTWGQPQLFEFNNPEYNIGYPSISADGNTLYFASDIPGGFGGFDLYKIQKNEDNTWGDPINLGIDINTPFNDSYPFIAGNVLYFSSYGHPGFGGFDIFYSSISDEGVFSTPINMGVPVNSSADDFGFIIDENYSRGFFSSNRPGGDGEDDLFSFRVISQNFTVEGRVTDYLTGAPIPGLELFFFDQNNNFFSTLTDINGFYRLPELRTDVDYYIAAYPENYRELADTLTVRDQLLSSRFEVITNYERNFALIPLNVVRDQAATQPEEIAPQIPPTPPVTAAIQEQEQDRINARLAAGRDQFILSPEGLPIIYFDFNKSTLRPLSVMQLDTVARFLSSNPDKGLIIHGHTDEISGYLINFYLSQQRAHSIINHLLKEGIDPMRLYPQGHGKMQLYVRNADTEQEHQLNRRANFESIPMSQLQAYLENASRHSFRYLNSINKEAHFAEGIEFMVQFMASSVPINPAYYRKIMENIPDVNIIYYYSSDRFHRYLVGSFRDFDSAFAMQRKLRQLGYQIYVVSFHNGERIPVSQARRMVAEGN